MIEYHGYRVDPEAGLVYGLRDVPLGSLNGSGYLQMDGRRAGLKRPHVARFIWEAVNGPIPPKMEINHINGVKTDNRIANLELVTHQQNIQHAYATGLKSNTGERHPQALLTEDTVRQLRRLYRRWTHNARVLAERFGLKRRCVADALSGRTWGHVTEDES